MKTLDKIIQEEYQKILQEQQIITKILPLSPGDKRLVKSKPGYVSGFKLVRKERGSRMTKDDIIDSINQSSQFGSRSRFNNGNYKYIVGNPIKDRKGKQVVNVFVVEKQDDDDPSLYEIGNITIYFPNQQKTDDAQIIKKSNQKDKSVDVDQQIDPSDVEIIDQDEEEAEVDDIVDIEKIQSFNGSSTYGISGAKPGGINDSWGGTMGKLLGLFSALKKKFPDIKISSLKRNKSTTKSGKRSDHWSGSKDSYGIDIVGFDTVIGNKIEDTVGDKVFLNSLKSVGHKPVTKGGVFNKTVDDIRYQIIWRTNIGGDHYNHVHIGARNKSLNFKPDGLIVGDQGEDVKTLQSALKTLGYDLGTYGPNKDGIDGQFGTTTRNALIEFQKDNNLEPTGDLDQQTANLLIKLRDEKNNQSTDNQDDQSIDNQEIQTINWDDGAKYVGTMDVDKKPLKGTWVSGDGNFKWIGTWSGWKLIEGIKDVNKNTTEGNRIVGKWNNNGDFTNGIELFDYWSYNNKEENYGYIFHSDPSNEIYRTAVDGPWEQKIKQFPDDMKAVISAAKIAKSV